MGVHDDVEAVEVFVHGGEVDAAGKKVARQRHLVVAAMDQDLAVRLPLMVLPRWLQTRSYPIAIDDVVAAIVHAARSEAPDIAGCYDVPGPECLSAEEILKRIAHLRGIEASAVLAGAVLAGASALASMRVASMGCRASCSTFTEASSFSSSSATRSSAAPLAVTSF